MDTIGQFEIKKYRELREGRLTASFFGRIMSRRTTTCPKNLVNDILSTDFDNYRSKAIVFGIENEGKAIALFEKLVKKTVRKDRIFIDTEKGI